MRDLGWIEGRNVEIEYRFAGVDADLINRHVTEAVKLAPDVIVANSSPVTAAVRLATTTIPVVFAVVNDPVGQGFISNLSHPGSNITGFSFFEREMIGKWVGMLTDIKPDLSQITLMFNPDTAPYRSLPDVDLDEFVDALAIRIASFDKRAIIDTKRLVNAASLPPDVEIGAGWDACIDSFMRPAAQERIKTLIERGFQKPGNAENRLGYYLGQLGR